jgi:protein SCO1/2
MTLQILGNVRRELMDSGAQALPRIVLVSVDPERDTPEVLGQYVDYFGEGSLGLTGEIEGIRTLTAALGIYFEKVATSDGDYGVDHSAAVLVINPKGEFSALFSAPHTVANYVHDLPIIMGTN